MVTMWDDMQYNNHLTIYIIMMYTLKIYNILKAKEEAPII